jgi:hypothetical protein
MTEDNCPSGPRVPLYQLAEWIVSQGGARQLDTRPTKLPGSVADVCGEDEWIALGWSKELIEAWDYALVELLQAIHGEEITIRGFRDGNASRALETVAGDEFGYEVANPYADTPIALILGERGRYLDLSPESATITDGRKVYWSDLVASGEEIRRRWPPAITQDGSQALSKGRTKPERIATWLIANHTERPALSIKELAKLIRREAPEIGSFSERTLKSAVKLAWL